ncbi:hypothetical protein THIARS_70597 [Thiomonas delicata]|uniref:Uncharacterized protein n=1 Tax=Thiomonas delicata TaxID=364030 RepID=A0A238D6N6_THIDL|nr:hypothetical protein THIARS_70597 [Thiomonas delicata]
MSENVILVFGVCGVNLRKITPIMNFFMGMAWEYWQLVIKFQCN